MRTVLALLCLVSSANAEMVRFTGRYRADGSYRQTGPHDVAPAPGWFNVDLETDGVNLKVNFWRFSHDRVAEFSSGGTIEASAFAEYPQGAETVLQFFPNGERRFSLPFTGTVHGEYFADGGYSQELPVVPYEHASWQFPVSLNFENFDDGVLVIEPEPALQMRVNGSEGLFLKPYVPSADTCWTSGTITFPRAELYAVPEPHTLALFAIAAAMLGYLIRREKRSE